MAEVQKMKKSAFFMGCVAIVIGCSAIAAPNPSQLPLQIVQELYKPYLDDPHAEKSNSPNALSLIEPHASTSLKTDIEKEQNCQKQEAGICDLDFDIIVNAQDWNISNFKLKEVFLKPDDSRLTKPAIDATFMNGGKNLVRYVFVQENGTWKISDIETTRFNKGGKVESYSVLTSLLNKQSDSPK